MMDDSFRQKLVTILAGQLNEKRLAMLFVDFVLQARLAAREQKQYDRMFAHDQQFESLIPPGWLVLKATRSYRTWLIVAVKDAVQVARDPGVMGAIAGLNKCQIDPSQHEKQRVYQELNAMRTLRDRLEQFYERIEGLPPGRAHGCESPLKAERGTEE